tara:strand:+ start:210 stop:878 length:669 start_codon:yes stop_codon:yes gene_type:complete
MPLIQLQDVKKTYDLDKIKVNVLNGISLEIEKGDFIAIIGPSGSGKSTAMNLIGSLDLPTEGNIIINNTNIKKLSKSQLATLRGKKIGFIFQTFNLIPSINAIQNVMLPMIFQNIPKQDRIKRAKELLKLVNLEHRAHHLPTELSGGERQRIAIARALINNPEIILADEPTGNLDSKTGEEILNLLIKLNKQGSTILMITHNQNIAKKANKTIKIIDGVIKK